MSDLGYADFADRLGDEFAVEGAPLTLKLASAKELPGSPRDAGGFQLEFHGPADPVLAQGIFPLAQGPDRFELFLVPIARDEERTRYDCTFF